MTEPVQALVRDVELSRPLPAIAPVDGDGRAAFRAYVLVRMCTEPIGTVLLDVPSTELGASDLAAAIEARLGDRIRERADAAGARMTGPLDAGGIRIGGDVPYLVERDAVLAEAPHITVAVCTRNQPDGLRRLLDSVVSCAYPRYRILVIDNAAADDRAERVARAAAEHAPVSYVREPRPGLSNARNRALVETRGEIVAWTDDDAVADEFWLAEIARALHRNPSADVVSGPIVPAELVTRPQLWFESFGGHSKGRGFTPFVFAPPYQQDPLFPLPPFGTGANMAWRPGVAESIGGFDPALGAGTPAMGSEDTLAFMSVLRAGGTIVYHPGAIVRHYHRRDIDGLRRQLTGYGTGLTAAYASLVRSHPATLIGLARLAPRALRELYSGSGLRAGGLDDDFPRDLLRANRRGMLCGPFAYVRGRRRPAPMVARDRVGNRL
jgi:glycosyltransferase involved in cell wall biosynthesis